MKIADTAELSFGSENEVDPVLMDISLCVSVSICVATHRHSLSTLVLQVVRKYFPTERVGVVCVCDDKYQVSRHYCDDSEQALLVASYTGLLAPAFVACCTNVGEGLVKLSHGQ